MSRFTFHVSRFTFHTLYLVCITLLLIPLSPAHAQEPTFTETFDDPSLPGWEHTPGATVVDGALHLEPGGFAFHPGAWGDFTLTVRLRRTGEGALVVSYRAGESGAYLVWLGGDTLALQREAEGQVTELDAVPYSWPLGEWQELSVTVERGEHTIALGGEKLLIVTEAALLPPGGLGFETLGTLIAEIDEVHLSGLGEPGLPPTEAEPPLPTEAPAPAETSASPVLAESSLVWVYTGGPQGGLGYDIRMDPRNPDVMYVTDAWAGAFKSLDGGQTWFPINKGITARVGPSGDGIPVFSLTVDPNNPDTLWVGTQFGGGVFRSDDGGETWRSMSNGILERALTIRGFAVEPGNSNVVYLGGEVSSWEWNGEPLPGLGLDMTKGVVYKTVDGGQHWTRIWYGDNLTRYIWIHPQDHNLIYVSTGIFDREAANSNAETKDPGGVGILRSYDSGQTWEVLGVENGIRAHELYFGSLFMHPQNPDILFAAAGNDPYLWLLGSPLGAVYRSQDGGDSWARVLGLDNLSAVEVCESNPDVVYAASLNGFWRSDDGGDQWQELGGELWGPEDVAAGFPIDLQCDPRNPMRIFVNNYVGGNFLSTDGGQTWATASKGYTGALMNQVAVAQGDPSLVYATARSGIFVSSDGGDNWHGLSRGLARPLEAHAIAVDPQDSAHILATIGDAGPIPKISYNGGQTWKDARPELGEELSFLDWGLMKKVYFSPTETGRVLGIQGEEDCGEQGTCEEGRGVLYSADGGETWRLSDLAEGMVTDLAFAPGGSIYAAVYPGDLYRSTDGGETWALVARGITAGIEVSDPDMPGPVLTALAVDPQDANTLYAGFFRGGVMVSRDGGATWEISSVGLTPETTVTDLVADATHPGSVYAATNDSGVFVSRDGGARWEALNNGLLTRAAVSLALSANGNTLYLATTGGGVFRLGTPAKGAVPPAEAAQPTTVPEPAPEPSAPEPEPEGGGGLPCLGGALPLAVVGLVWVRRRK